MSSGDPPSFNSQHFFLSLITTVSACKIKYFLDFSMKNLQWPGDKPVPDGEPPSLQIVLLSASGSS